MEIVPLGDSALIVRVREQFDDAPEETLNEVLQTFQQLRSAAIPGVIELAPAYTSVAVFFDPVAVSKAFASGTSGGMDSAAMELLRTFPADPPESSIRFRRDSPLLGEAVPPQGSPRRA